VRAEAYRTWLKQGASDDELIAIRQRRSKSVPLEANAFRSWRKDAGHPAQASSTSQNQACGHLTSSVPVSVSRLPQFPGNLARRKEPMDHLPQKELPCQ
jgi:hypothetical protein